MAVTEKTNKLLKIEQGNLYATIQPKQGERIMIIGGSEILTARCSDAGAAVLPAVSFSQVKQNEFDVVTAPLSVHSYADGAQWTAKAYEALRDGGWFVADFAEADSLPSTTDYPYVETLAGYWERLKASGFTTILFQQLSADSPKEAVLNGWTELMSSKYPVTVNRFIAVK
ncbi:class I SAM-dependent methyltransferase [Domibacillus indicus]|uniref:hypothetical protein n=1 Tax=Domibacillus indicus TaxID=1437523 RepID=UPI000617B59E|nr:hypothetical protein [Domibacillus indicus]